MTKLLTDRELLQIVNNAVFAKDGIDGTDQYLEFLDDLGMLIGKHFGAAAGTAGIDEEVGYCMPFNINENTPPDGGVFKAYDMDIPWKDGEEVELKPEPKRKFFRVTETLKAGSGDDLDGLYVCEAKDEEEVKRKWVSGYYDDNSGGVIEDLVLAEEPEYETNDGNTFVLSCIKEISEDHFNVLKMHVPELTRA